MAGGVSRDRPSLTSVAGLQVGHAGDPEARTGCTVILGPFRGAVEVRGLATGSRELDAFSPMHVVPRVDALLLTGGSAFGLAAADGVAAWLEARGRGYPTSAGRVPIVPAAVIYDLSVGDPSVRPDAAMGRAAAEAAGTEAVAEGAVGAGTGATVGKLRGVRASEPGGVGSWAERIPFPGRAAQAGRERGREARAGAGSADAGTAVVGALAVVNAFGDVVDGTGRILAGCRAPAGGHLNSERALLAGEPVGGFGAAPSGRQCTTLGVVAADRPLGSRALALMARQAMHGLLSRIRPAATPLDGDTVFALAPPAPGGAGGEDDLLETLPLALAARRVLERAVERAVGGGGRGARRPVVAEARP